MAPAEVGVGRRNDSFGWIWIYHSNTRVLFSSPYLCITFYSMSTSSTVLNFGHVGPIETPGSRDRRGPDSRSREDSPLDGSIDLWMDGWMDGWSSDIWVELARTKKGDKVVLALSLAAANANGERPTTTAEAGREIVGTSRESLRSETAPVAGRRRR